LILIAISWYWFYQPSISVIWLQIKCWINTVRNDGGNQVYCVSHYLNYWSCYTAKPQNYKWPQWTSRQSQIELCAGAGAPAYFAGAGAGVGKLRQKLRQTKLWKIISYFNEHLALNGKIKLLFTNILLFICCFTIYYYVVYY
jgi:hypothetical protein